MSNAPFNVDDAEAFARLKATFDEALAELDRTGGTPDDFDEIRRKGRELAARNANPLSPLAPGQTS